MAEGWCDSIGGLSNPGRPTILHSFRLTLRANRRFCKGSEANGSLGQRTDPSGSVSLHRNSSQSRPIERTPPHPGWPSFLHACPRGRALSISFSGRSFREWKPSSVAALFTVSRHRATSHSIRLDNHRLRGRRDHRGNSPGPAGRAQRDDELSPSSEAIESASDLNMPAVSRRSSNACCRVTHTGDRNRSSRGRRRWRSS